jgi:hypothetical protein
MSWGRSNHLNLFRISGFKFQIFVLSIVFLCGCEGPKRTPQSQEKVPEAANRVVVPQENLKKAVNLPEEKPNAFNPFYIFSEKGSRQNHYIPSGFMPDGECLVLDDAWGQNCQSGKTCVKVDYNVACSRESQRWAGIYWLNPANNWGRRKGGFDLTGAQKLTFWAKGEKGGEQIQEFTVGGISGNYPDSDMAVMGPVILSEEWREYVVDLRGKDLSYISGGFAWSTSEEVNPESCVFYLDEIRFE